MMTTIAGFTGIIEIDGIWFVVEDGQAYYFDNRDKEDYDGATRHNLRHKSD